MTPVNAIDSIPAAQHAEAPNADVRAAASAPPESLPARRPAASLVGRWSSRQKPILYSRWTGLEGRR